jgi:hypothetical protein
MLCATGALECGASAPLWIDALGQSPGRKSPFFAGKFSKSVPSFQVLANISDSPSSLH